MIEVVLYSKPDCHLCENVKAQLARLRPSFPFELREVNILDDPEDFERYKNDIPVIFMNGRKAFKHRLSDQDFIRRFEMMLAAERKPADGT
jgi:glutaredoxin